MDYLAISDNASRQIINSSAVFQEYRRIKKLLSSVAGGMYWKRQGKYEYLVKTDLNNRQKRIGPRSPETEATFSAFVKRKDAVEQRWKSIKEAYKEAERLNRAIKAGRVPAIVIAVLNAIEDVNLGANFTVVGTHALYAYETAAGVRIAQGALASQDIDLLWDARKRVQFFTEMKRMDISMLDLLRKADPSFERKEEAPETAVSSKGFEVDFLRREPEEGDPHPLRLSEVVDDLWAIQAMGASILTNAPRFEQMVMSSNGQMALMRTIDPRIFVEFKRWMSKSAPNRPHAKKRRDLRQAQIVQSLMDDGLLMVPSELDSSSG